MAQAVLQVNHLSKYFGGVAANQDISLSLNKQEILAIVGENGAGKSTLCKMLTGVYHPDEGQILLEGKRVTFNSPSESIKAGISMVYQERNLVGMMSGSQNICLGQEPTKGILIDKKRLIAQAEETKRRLGLTIDLNTPAEKMGVGEQQLIEILRAFQTKPKILILDEPTASLGHGEIEPFLDFIKKIKNQTDIAIIFISHKLEEVYAIADKIAVFTDGQNVLCAPTSELTQEQCVSAMLRQNKIQPIEVPPFEPHIDQPLIKVNQVHYGGKDHHLGLEAYPGEVVGFYGLVGSGRTESMECLFGLRYAKNLNFEFNGDTIKKPTPDHMIDKGMILTPEKRMNGLFRALSLTANICNLFLDEFLSNKALGMVDRKRSKEFALRVLDDNNVKYKDVSQPVGSLSGGNMQKVIIGRSVALENIRLLIVDEPTTGMDIGAKYQVYHKLRGLAEQRKICVLMISSELDELLAVCDRMYVFAEGNCIDSMPRSEFHKRRIMETAIRGRRLS